MTSPDDPDSRPSPPLRPNEDEAAGSPPPPPPPPPPTSGWTPAPRSEEPAGAPWGPPSGEPWRPSPSPAPSSGSGGSGDPGGREPWADPAPGTGSPGPAGGADALWAQPGATESGSGVPPNWRPPSSGQWPTPPPPPPDWPPPLATERPSEPSEIWTPRPGPSTQPEAPFAPLSPAYSTPASPAYFAAPPSAPPPLVETSEPPRHRRGWLFAGLGVLAVAALAAGAFVLLRGDSGDEGYVFGTVGSAAGDVMVHTGDDEARPLVEGESIEAGWVVEAPGASAVTVDLADGGVVRFDSGATLTFLDRAETSGDGGDPRPAIEMDRGRTWLNPAGEGPSAGIALDIPAASVALSGNPVALDCTSTCTIEAPGGGVTVTTDGDLDAVPGPNENLQVQDESTLAVTTAAGPSAWAQQNLDADSQAGLPAPGTVDAPGIKGTAVVDGTYALTLTVTGDPSGDGIPSELTFLNGKQFTVNLVVDGSGCVTVPCDVNVTADDGATGTARIEAGTMNLSFTQPIDCYDETFTNVVVTGIGTTAVQAQLTITDVTQDGERWVASAVDGEGTVAANLATRCNEGETLGTSTSPMHLAGAGGL